MKLVLDKVAYQGKIWLYGVHHNFWLFYDLLRERGHSDASELAGIGRGGGGDMCGAAAAVVSQFTND